MKPEINNTSNEVASGDQLSVLIVLASKTDCVSKDFKCIKWDFYTKIQNMNLKSRKLFFMRTLYMRRFNIFLMGFWQDFKNLTSYNVMQLYL